MLTLRSLGIILTFLAAPAYADGTDTEIPECDNEPVIMSVAGITKDAEIMRQYAKALAASGIYPELRGYYMNAPRPVAVFEGDVPQNHVTLLVRFPCLAHAKAFWYSKVYQEQVKPLRTENDAGDYLVTVYKEINPPAYMDGKVEGGAYLETFEDQSTQGIEQID